MNSKHSQALSSALLISWLFVCVAGFTGPAPQQQVTVHSGDNLAAIVAQNPSGTEFHIQAGVYRMQSITPKPGDSFLGDPGAVLNGSRLLTGFSQSGRFWTTPVQIVERPSYRGECADAHPFCKFPADIYFDDRPLTRVGDQEAVAPGTWYLNPSSQTAYFADDPSGHTVEMGIRQFAFRGDAPNVRIEGLTIAKYACEAGDGAIDGRSASGQHLSQNWVVQDNVVTLNHGVGIRIGDGMQVLRNKAILNGQLGIGGGGTNGVVDGNEIARNNYAGYKYDWEAGGSKFAFTHNLIVRNNNAHDNGGPGLWTDLENENTLYEHNHTASNRGAGIQHEVSYSATIRDNVIENDGFSDYHKTAPWYGAGIVIAGSSDVEVFGNTVKNCMNGIIGTQPQRETSRRGTPYQLKNLNVHDNIVIQNEGTAAGIVRAGLQNDDVFDSWNNHFVNNQFQFADSSARYFAWKGSQLSYNDWKAKMR